MVSVSYKSSLPNRQTVVFHQRSATSLTLRVCRQSSHGVASASIFILNYLPSYSSSSVLQSSAERSVLLARSIPYLTKTISLMLSLIQQQQGVVSPSSVLTCYTKGTATFLSYTGPSNPRNREAVRTATSVLCKEMLRPTERPNLGLYDSKEVVVRLQALAELEREWGGNNISGSATQNGALRTTRTTRISGPGEENERMLFAEALRDGYVLCQ